MLRSVGHRTHKVSPSVDNERGDIEIGIYIVLPCGQDNHPPPRPLLLDFTITHDRFGLSNLHTNGKLTQCLRSTGPPQTDGVLNNATHIGNNHYRQNYDELPEPVVFLTVSVSTSGRVNEEFLRLLFLDVNREASVLTGELSEESTDSIPFHSSLFG